MDRPSGMQPSTRDQDSVHEPLITIAEAAEYWRIHVFTAYRLAKQKRIPMFKVNRQWRMRREDLELFTDGIQK